LFKKSGIDQHNAAMTAQSADDLIAQASSGLQQNADDQHEEGDDEQRAPRRRRSNDAAPRGSAPAAPTSKPPSVTSTGATAAPATSSSSSPARSLADTLAEVQRRLASSSTVRSPSSLDSSSSSSDDDDDDNNNNNDDDDAASSTSTPRFEDGIVIATDMNQSSPEQVKTLKVCSIAFMVAPLRLSIARTSSDRTDEVGRSCRSAIHQLERRNRSKEESGTSKRGELCASVTTRATSYALLQIDKIDAQLKQTDSVLVRADTQSAKRNARPLSQVVVECETLSDDESETESSDNEHSDSSSSASPHRDDNNEN
jgi:hypothetical protein